MTVKYTPDHEWVELDGDEGIATVGITLHAQDALGDVVFVDLPAVGTVLAKQAVVGVVRASLMLRGALVKSTAKRSRLTRLTAKSWIFLSRAWAMLLPYRHKPLKQRPKRRATVRSMLATMQRNLPVSRRSPPSPRPTYMRTPLTGSPLSAKVKAFGPKTMVSFNSIATLPVSLHRSNMVY